MIKSIIIILEFLVILYLLSIIVNSGIGTQMIISNITAVI